MTGLDFTLHMKSTTTSTKVVLTVSQKLSLSLAGCMAIGIVVWLVDRKIHTQIQETEGFAAKLSSVPSPKSNTDTMCVDEGGGGDDDDDESMDGYQGYSEGYSPFPPKRPRPRRGADDDDDDGYGYGYGREGFQEGLSIDDIGNQFKQMDNFFKALGKIGERFGRFIKSFVEFGDGIVIFAKNLGEILRVTLTDVFSLFGDCMQCGMKYLYNFRICIFFWVLDCVLHILKAICYSFPIFLVRVLTGLNLEPLFQDFYEWVLVPLDSLIYNTTRCHFLHFPQWVLDDCYACDVIDDLFQLLFDFGFTVPELLLEPVGKLLMAAADFFSMFAPF